MGLKMGLSRLLISEMSSIFLYLCLAILFTLATSKAALFRLEISSTECDIVAIKSFTAALDVERVSGFAPGKGNPPPQNCRFSRPFHPSRVGLRLRRRLYRSLILCLIFGVAADGPPEPCQSPIFKVDAGGRKFPADTEFSLRLPPVDENSLLIPKPRAVGLVPCLGYAEALCGSKPTPRVYGDNTKCAYCNLLNAVLHLPPFLGPSPLSDLHSLPRVGVG